METLSPELGAEGLLGLFKFTIELLNPNHKLATRNLEEILFTFKHEFKTKQIRLECVAVPQQVIRSSLPVQNNDTPRLDEESCALVGVKAAMILGIPVGGSCLGLASKCLCPLTNDRVCSPRCKAPGRNPRIYSILIASNRRVPPYRIFMNETMLYNIITSLYGSDYFGQRNIVLNIGRCDQILKRTPAVLKFADKAVVSWIEQPQNTENSVFSTCLNGYFQVPRHLHKGDVFKVQISEYAPEVLFTLGNFSLEDMYFTVKSIEGPLCKGIRNVGESIGFMVTKGKTLMIQDVNAHSYLPGNTLSTSSCLSQLITKYPHGLKSTYIKLLNSFQPFLKGVSLGLKPAFLLSGPHGCGKERLVSCAADQLGMNFWTIDCAEIRGSTSGQTAGKLKAVMSKAKQYAPCVFLMSSIEILSRDQDGHQDSRVLEDFSEELESLKGLKPPVIIVGTTPSASDLSSALGRMFLLEISVPSLSKEERKTQLIQLCKLQNISVSLECLEEVASRCSGFLLGDLTELVALAIRNNICAKEQLESSSENGVHPQTILTDENFNCALDKLQSAYAGSIGAPKIPSVQWKDVGGLENVKKEILQTVTMPLKHPELTASGLGRSGILLYGPPGTGKTLLAKAVATECSLNFLSVKGPELLNMYVGQSEANVREIFERAREASPCIIFFDELDALAPNRGRNGDSGGVMDRVVSQLLSEMDGLQKSGLLFVMGATNRPDLIDPALLRPGRFDKLLYIGAYDNSVSRVSVLSALTRKFKLSSDVNLLEISNQLPSEVTGADMYAVCAGAWLGAVRRIIRRNLNDNQRALTEVEVCQLDFNQAVANVAPSVSPEDMLYYKRLQMQMSALPVK